jgi:hypothetical protein
MTGDFFDVSFLLQNRGRRMRVTMLTLSSLPAVLRLRSSFYNLKGEHQTLKHSSVNTTEGEINETDFQRVDWWSTYRGQTSRQ